jgi:Phage integrase family
MVVHFQGGKGRKDRDVMLSSKLLEELREHWHRLRRKPQVWLFPGNHDHCSDQPIDTKTVWNACKQAAKRAVIQKGVPSPCHSAFSCSAHLNRSSHNQQQLGPGASSLSLLLRLLAPPVSPDPYLRLTLPRRPSSPTVIPFSMPSFLPCRTPSTHLHAALFHHSIPMGPRVHRNHGRLPSNGFIERARSSLPACTRQPKRASDKALTFTRICPSDGRPTSGA